MGKHGYIKYNIKNTKQRGGVKNTVFSTTSLSPGHVNNGWVLQEMEDSSIPIIP